MPNFKGTAGTQENSCKRAQMAKLHFHTNPLPRNSEIDVGLNTLALTFLI